MILETTPLLLQNLYWITLLAVIVSSASGVLKAGFKQFDLFGVVMIAITTGLGGGSLRDMLLDRDVFWIADQIFFIASIASALCLFIAARFIVISPKYFLIADAAGLATFAIAGTLVSLMLGTSPLVASFMGVITGAMGGGYFVMCYAMKPPWFSPAHFMPQYLGWAHCSLSGCSPLRLKPPTPPSLQA